MARGLVNKRTNIHKPKEGIDYMAYPEAHTYSSVASDGTVDGFLHWEFTPSKT